MRCFLLISFCIALLASSSASVLAQNKAAKDSLENLLEQTSGHEKKVFLLLKLSELHHGSDNLKAAEYAHTALNLAEGINSVNAKANALLWLSYAYSGLGKEDEGFAYGMKALDYFKKTGDKRQIVICQNSLAGVYDLSGNYDKATELWLEALRGAENIKNDTLIAKLCNNVGQVQARNEKHNAAIKYYERAAKIFGRMPDRVYEACVIKSNLAASYMSLQKYDVALLTFRELEKVAQVKEKNGFIGTVYTNIARVEAYKDNHEESLKYFDMAISTFESMDDFVGMCELLTDKGELLSKLKRDDEALAAIERAKDLSKYTDNRLSIRRVHEALSQYYSERKNYAEAYKNLERYVILNDSIFTIEKNNAMAEMAIRYNVEKTEQSIKEQDLLLANKDQILKQQKTIIIGFAIFLVLILVLAVLMYRNIREKRKLYKDLQNTNNEMLLQKDRIAHQSKQITDSIRCANQIQEAILPTEKHIRDYFADAFLVYMPKDIVSGDFYWFSVVGKSRLIAVADCTGHGVPGALMSAIANTILQDIVNQEGITNPSQILRLLDNAYRKLLNQDASANNDVIDIVLCNIEVAENQKYKVQFAGAARPFVYTTNGQIRLVKGDSQSLGGRETKHRPVYAMSEVVLNKGDNIYLFSDGFGDQFSPQRQKFSSRKLVDLLYAHHNLDHSAQKASVLDALKTHRGDAQQIDDITVLGVML